LLSVAGWALQRRKNALETAADQREIGSRQDNPDIVVTYLTAALIIPTVQTLAAVALPVAEAPSLMIAPAPTKPTPVITP
jgi:hypothetical protein